MKGDGEGRRMKKGSKEDYEGYDNSFDMAAASTKEEG